MSLVARLCSTLAAVLALLLAHGCNCELGFRQLELDLDADLRAVVWFDDFGFEGKQRVYHNLAVADGNSVAAWGYDLESESGYFSETFSLGDVELRGVAGNGGFAPIWWAVGDNGFAALSEDWGQTWTTLDLAGSTANLHAIIDTGSRMVVVGDQVVLVQGIDGSWSEPTPPAGGWGQLRAVVWNGSRIWAVGLGGVIRSASDPGHEWIAESSGVTSDLFAVAEWRVDGEDRMVAVGAAGTLLIRDADGWRRARTRENVTLVDFADGVALGSGGQLFDVNKRGKLSLLETFPGARALSVSWTSEFTIAGDDGLIVRASTLGCGE
jgi:hypothetical protein